MTSFEVAYQLWRETSVPHGAHRSDFVEIFHDVVLVDTWVAGEALPAARHGIPGPLAVDVAAGIDTIERRVSDIVRGGQLTDQEQAQADAYLHYLAVLRGLHVELDRLRNGESDPDA
jgi:hypothetical protein